MQPASSRRLLLIAVLPLAFAALLPLVFQRSQSKPRVVVYCAHDSIFADAVLRKFQQQTGIEVTVRYDEEASKSLGLTQLLMAEQHAPRCDVFWNNQTLGTIRLQQAGLLKRCPPEWFAQYPGTLPGPGRTLVRVCWSIPRLDCQHQPHAGERGRGESGLCGFRLKSLQYGGTVVWHHADSLHRAGS
jgi:hypothetical protein